MITLDIGLLPITVEYLTSQLVSYVACLEGNGNGSNYWMTSLYIIAKSVYKNSYIMFKVNWIQKSFV